MSRIVLLPSAYLPSLGGVEELTRHLALALVAAGDEVEIWAQRDDAATWPAVEVMDGVTVRRFSFPLPRSHPGAIARFIAGAIPTVAALRSATRSFRPDLLHVQCFGPNGLYATILSHLTGVPLVVSLQGETVMDDHAAYEVSATLRTALRMGLRRARLVTACSNFALADARLHFGLRPDRGLVVFNGVSVADQPLAPPTPDSRYVLALGRLEAKKGFDLLIRAYAAVSEAHSDVELVIAGSGSASQDLAELAQELGLAAKVRLTGRLERQEVARVMAGAEVFVMPSRVEPFGIVTLEAWRAGVAAIVTSHGGPSEFVTDFENGLIVDPFDSEALAHAINLLLGDPDLRGRIARAGRRKVAEFDWGIIAEQYRSCYRRVA